MNATVFTLGPLFLIFQIIPYTQNQSDFVINTKNTVINTIQSYMEEINKDKVSPVLGTILQTTLNRCDKLGKIFYEYNPIRFLDTTASRTLRLEYIHDMALEKITYFELEKSDEFDFKQVIDRSSPVIIFIHGFLSGPLVGQSGSIITVLKEVGFKNVFSLDATFYLNSIVYPESSGFVKDIGMKLGKILVQMTKSGVNPLSIHLIGHSLGAHIAAFAGITLLETTGKKVRRITGLDPAGPCFMKNFTTRRLSAGDAVFVDVIHTNSEVFGIPDAEGDADFYPNGGEIQPGCGIVGCSHSRSIAFYVQSLKNSSRFASRACDSWKMYTDRMCDVNALNHMGYGADPNLKGKFFLRTTSSAPFNIDERPFGFFENIKNYVEPRLALINRFIRSTISRVF